MQTLYATVLVLHAAARVVERDPTTARTTLERMAAEAAAHLHELFERADRPSGAERPSERDPEGPP